MKLDSEPEFLTGGASEFQRVAVIQLDQSLFRVITEVAAQHIE